MPKNTLVRWIIDTLAPIIGIEKLPIKDYFCLCRGAAVITGIAYTQWLVDVAVVDILVSYFTDTWEKDNVLSFAVLMVNLLWGLSSVLEVAMTYISDIHVTHHKVILSSVAAYIIGMVMLCISAFGRIPGDEGGVFFAATVLLISVGRAGGLPILENFLDCELRAHDQKESRAHEPRQQDIDEGKVQARKFVWWNTAKLLCKLSSPWMFGYGSWPATFMVSTSVMGTGFFLFWCGIPLYHHRSLDKAAATTEIPHGASREENTNNGPTPAVSLEIPSGASPEENINNGPTPAVSSEIPRGASPKEVTNNDLTLAVSSEIPRGASSEENTNNGPTPVVSPEISRGASPEENTNNGPTPVVSPKIPRGASPEEVTNNDPTLAVSPEIPRGASSEENTNNGPNRAVSLEISRGASPEENTNNHPTPVLSARRRLMEKWKSLFIMIPMWTSFLIFGLVLSTGYSFYTLQGSTMEPTVSIYILIMIWKMTKYTSSFFSTLLLKTRKTKGITVGIWTAMFVSVICCYVAWRVEIRRLHAIAEDDLCVDQDYYVPLSIMRLAPQSCLLGLTEGIGREGLDLFFEVQVSDDVQMKIYGSALNEAVIGLGSFLNAILVFRFKNWFGDTLNCSTRLDKYYQMLMILSFVNLCYYSGFVSIYYSNKNKTKDYLQVEAAGAG